MNFNSCKNLYKISKRFNRDAKTDKTRFFMKNLDWSNNI